MNGSGNDNDNDNGDGNGNEAFIKDPKALNTKFQVHTTLQS